MITHINLAKADFQAIRDETQWEPFIRKIEIGKIYDQFGEDHFDTALELGCGSGKYSKYLSFYCKKLIAIEYCESRLTEHGDDKTTFEIGDAQNLTRFSNSQMDLIFSSNLIEHLPNPDQCLAECKRVVKPEGLIIHTVPNRTWKVFTLLLYYPFGIKVILWRMFSRNKSAWLSRFTDTKIKLDGNLRLRSNTYSLKKHLLPKTHGIYKSHLSEFKSWGEKHWINMFERKGLEVINIVRLPFYFAWGYNFRFILRLGNYLGLSSSTAFVLKKKE